MFYDCSNCGEFRSDHLIEPGDQPGQAYAACPVCGYKQPFLQLPLLLVGGASGAGKTSVYRYLMNRVKAAVLLDLDILWSEAFVHKEDQYRSFYETWLNMCKHISQAGRPVVLFGAGSGVPANMEACMERRFFATLHYLALTCEEEVLRDRLLMRPAWRGCDEAFIKTQIDFNRWFLSYASLPPITCLDTTGIPLEKTAEQVSNWIEARVPPLSPAP